MLGQLLKPQQGLVRTQTAAAAYAVLALVCLAVGEAVASMGQEKKCSPGGTVQAMVGVTSKTVSFICDSTAPDLLPAKKADASTFDQCYDDKTCTNAKEYSAVVGADVGLAVAGPVDAVADKQYLVTVQKLPKEAKTVFFLCSEKALSSKESSPSVPAEKKCTVEVSIPGKPPADTCAEEGATITVEVNPTQKSAVFNCGGDLTSLQPATARVYRDDCTTEVSLEEELPSAKLTSENLRNTLSLSELPTAEKTLCYKCVDKVEKSSSSKQCTVKVKVPSSGSQSGAARASTSILAVMTLAFMCLQ